MAAPGRLKSRKDFSRVAAKGRHFRSGNLRMRYISTGSLESRVGFTVPERTAKSAVRRNRLRRILRERLRVMADTISPGYDFVITVTRDPETNEGHLLREQIDNLLMEAGITGKVG